MTSKQQTRRHFLSLIAPVTAGLVAAVVAPGLAAGQIACSDPDADSTEGLRRSMNYQPIARNAAKSCLNCTFYAAVGSESCGRCQILSGIVNADGSCDAWSRSNG